MKLSARTLLSIFVGFCSATSVFAANAQATEDLIAACTAPQGEDDVSAVKLAISNGADINAKEERSGQTPLMASVLRGKINIVRYLLVEAGADPSIGERSGFLPPDGAAFQGRPDVMQLLIDNGIKVDYHAHDGYSPFHRACWGPREGHAKTVEVLIRAGLDPNHLSQGHANDHPHSRCIDMTENEETRKILSRFEALGEL
eukprot:CAMPEP_0178948470 /NCGR_PEP_ID=MMETSP0789-20121207/5497_1 /TAXON_ID=3005 /ORGANISM="Rhizosolenia setigera, Strain CCMP 1694" /LENGTH=200 /DNA_ID=CAMNT_0020628853 /DNA_START=85 /DNA_END=687 /DNA_ORIENTATION=-